MSSIIHPGEDRCASCGCTAFAPCIDELTGETCSWVEPGLCSACAPASGHLAIEGFEHLDAETLAQIDSFDELFARAAEGDAW